MKVAVYAIAKNEESFVDRWADSMSEADEIVVLDTGSDDKTAEKLRARNIKVICDTVTPWRFDRARNISLSLVSQDADICVCTDLDEVFKKGWRKSLEEQWKKDTRQARYRYTWSFNPDGSEGVVFWIEKIHSRHGFKWVHPVHEVLESDDYGRSNEIITLDDVELYHYPDSSKSRGQYLGLLELSVKEDPDDDRNRHYLGREYMYRGMWDKCIETLKFHLTMPSALWADERAASMRYIARAYIAKKETETAKLWYMQAIIQAPHLREAYMELAKLLYSADNYAGTVYFIKEGLKIRERPVTYICEAESWGAEPYDILSIALYNLGQKREALDASKKAHEICPDDKRIEKNIEIISREIMKKAPKKP